jgi:hypothetical protein
MSIVKRVTEYFSGSGNSSDPNKQENTDPNLSTPNPVQGDQSWLWLMALGGGGLMGGSALSNIFGQTNMATVTASNKITSGTSQPYQPPTVTSTSTFGPPAAYQDSWIQKKIGQ